VPPRLRRLSGADVTSALGHIEFLVVATRGSHAKLRRELPDGQRQTLTIPLHRELARGTLLAIYRQTLRYVAEGELRPWFFTD
jgi:predicted RNA binding protein YcfA (HicA-like mRNA interferase family)